MNKQIVIARPHSGRGNPVKHRWIASSLLLLAMTMIACNRNTTTWEYMPDMVDTAAVKAYEPDADSPLGRSARMPVKGTIPRGFEPYPYPDAPEAAGANLINPLARTAEVLAKGQKTYNTYCIVCHGSKGLDDGSIVPKFPRPPSLLAAKVVNWSDGRIFHVITRGQNLMPSYAAQMTAAERWAAIHYVRVLQRAGNPRPEDIKAVLDRVIIPSPPGGEGKGEGNK